MYKLKGGNYHVSVDISHYPQIGSLCLFYLNWIAYMHVIYISCIVCKPQGSVWQQFVKEVEQVRIICPIV